MDQHRSRVSTRHNHASAGNSRFFPPFSLIEAKLHMHRDTRRDQRREGGTGSIQLSETKLFNARGRSPSKRHVCGSWHRLIDIEAWHRVTPPSKKYILHECSCSRVEGVAVLFYLVGWLTGLFRSFFFLRRSSMFFLLISIKSYTRIQRSRTYV